MFFLLSLNWCKFALLEITAGEIFVKYQPKVLPINELTFCLKSTKKSPRKKPGNFSGSRDLGITFDCVSKKFLFTKCYSRCYRSGAMAVIEERTPLVFHVETT